MSQFEIAQRHLAEALGRLESALARRMARAPESDSSAVAQLGAERDDLASNVNVLRNECDRLSAALAELEDDHRGLREVSSHVADRLDGSLAELDRLLGK